jgi:mono/diheme cytochrome c family protein
MKLLRRYLAWKLFRWVLLAGVVAFGLAQAIPYGRSHTPPPTRNVIRWDSPTTRKLAIAACADCHTNLTTWPWYTNIAPASWLAQHDVDDGRSAFNLSTMDLTSGRATELLNEIDEAARGGEMPPWQYKLIHGNARLSTQQRAQLADGLQRTLRAMIAAGGR